MTDALPIRVIAGSPTDEEIAAIAALFTHLLLERSASTEALPGAPVRSAWERTARPLREPWPAEKDWFRR